MQYTPSQLRQSAGLSKETFRHWRRVVPALSGGRGHAPAFSAGDVLASAVLRRLTECCGVRIGNLTDVAKQVFDICNHTAWDVLSDSVLVLDLSEHICVAVAKSDRIPIDTAVVVCPLGPLVAHLQYDFLRSSPCSTQRPTRTAAGSETNPAATESRP